MDEDSLALLDSLIREKPPAREAIDELLQTCANRYSVPSNLLNIDFGGDYPEVTDWLQGVLRNEPPPSEVNTLFFGLFTAVFEDGREVTTLYLSGTSDYDEDIPLNELLEQWPGDPVYFPEGRYAQSRALAQMHSLEANFPEAHYLLSVGYVVLLINEWCRGPMSSLLLQDAPVRAIATGFDSGEAHLVEVLRSARP